MPDPQQSPVGPLHGIRVVELSRLIAGPSCAQILADLGADVVKVERSPAGDEVRQTGPGFVRDGEGRRTSLSSLFVACNRNKRSIALDFADEADLATLKALIARADVFIENFKPGGLARYGLDPESLSRAHPLLIHLSVTGFGSDSHLTDRPATDGVLQAISGFQSLNGEADGPPQRASVPVVDLCAGLYAAVAVLAALRSREVQGEPGQHCDIALLDSAMALVASRAIDYRLTGEVPRRNGNALSDSAPCNVYRCRDGDMFVQAAWDQRFQSLCEAIGRRDLAGDPRFAARPERVRNAAELDRELADSLRHWTLADLSEALSAAGVIFAPVNTIDCALESEPVLERGLEREMDGARGGRVPMIASPIRLSRTPVRYRMAPPEPDENREAILRDWLQDLPADTRG